jgi:hypothetical protein
MKNFKYFLKKKSHLAFVAQVIYNHLVKGAIIYAINMLGITAESGR